MLDAELLKKLGVNDPAAPVTMGDLTTYLAKVIQAERDRLAAVYLEAAHDPVMRPPDVEVAIRCGGLDVLSWK